MLAALLARIAQAHRNVAVAADKYWENVLTLSHFVGDNGQVAYRDERDNYPWNFAGNASILAGASAMNNGFNKQNGFLWVDGSGDRISRWMSEQIGDDDFTLEALIAPSNGGAGAAYGRVMEIGPNATNGGLWWIRSNNPNPLQLFSQLYASGYTNCMDTPADTIANDQFIAIALCRQGNDYFMFYNGVLVGTKTLVNATAHNIVQSDLYIGGNSSNAENFRGRYNALRITKGIARYTSNYTPSYRPFPTQGPSTVDPYWWNVVSLLPLSGADGATTFPDAKARIWSVAGNSHVVAAVSKFGHGSLYLDGAGDYLRCDDVARAIAGHDTFTIELWARSLQQMSDIGNFLSFNDSSGNNRILFQDSALYLTSANVFTYPFLPVDGVFHHVALVCDQGVYRVFIDGVMQGSVSNTTRITGTDRCTLGQEFDGSTASGFFNGYFEQLRVTKGVARYSPDFIPPSAPFPDAGVTASLLHFDGSDGGTAFTDRTGRTWAAYGNAQLDTSNSYFGGASLQLDGAGDWLRTTDVTNFDFGTGDFTIEGWVYIDNTTGSGIQWLMSAAVSSDSQGWAFGARHGSFGGVMRFYDYVSNTGFNGTTAVAVGGWHHIAASRQNGTLRLFLDGVLEKEAAMASSYPAPGFVNIGGSAQSGTPTQVSIACHIDEVRVSRTALYTANFTPAAAPFSNNLNGDPQFGSVLSLLHFDGADGATTFSDQKGITWTASGTAAITTTAPLLGTGSLLLDGGTSSYIVAASDPSFALGTGDFTVEWFAQQDAAKIVSHFDFRGGTASSPRLMVYNNNAAPYTDLRLYVSGADRIIAPTGTLLIGQRQHFAICRYNGLTSMYVDGVQVGNSWPDTTDYTAADWQIGASTAASTRGFNGRIDEFRVTKAARYTGSFTPPTEAFVDWVTSSLLHFDGEIGSSTITDQKAPVWTTTIAPSIQSDAGAIGECSGRFAGGAYVENTSKANWAFLHNGRSFTFEGFVTVDAIGAVQTIFTNNGLSSSNIGIGLWVDAAGALQAMVSRGVSSSAPLNVGVASAFTAGTRTHVALQYDSASNLYTLYVNGVSAWSGAPAQAFTVSAPTDQLRIGRNSSGSNAYALTGNFDEWRLTNGKARYTSDFTPPTTPYSDND